MKKILLSGFMVSLIIIVAGAQVTNGLVGYYPFNGNAKDESGKNHNGTVFNATLTKDRFGINKKAYSFNGVDTRIEIADNDDFHLANVTVSAWLYLDTSLTTAPYQSFVSKSVGSGTFNSYVCYYDNAALAAGGYFSNGSVDQNITTPYNIYGKWFHYTFTYNDATDTKQLYINGSLAATGTTTLTLGYDNSPLTIGCEYQSNQLMFFVNGKIDEVRIYNRVLSLSEIDSLYADGCSKPIGLKVTNITSTSAKLKWDSIPGATAYRISTRKKNKTTYKTTDVTTNSKQISNLSANTTYEWTVQSICSSSPLVLSDTAAGKDFKTAVFTANEKSEIQLPTGKEFNASVYPNPVKNAATLSISNNHLPVSIMVQNMYGKILLRKDHVADSNITLSLQNFAPGTYVVKINNGKQSKTIKLVKTE